mmetsp:Transcript_13538/g.44751  ORF Transcript_13538/g.44751 Transcript_13538/m.44751 type:complete len:239 (-) Transcript_13538:1321-2037(-)
MKRCPRDWFFAVEHAPAASGDPRAAPPRARAERQHELFQGRRVQLARKQHLDIRYLGRGLVRGDVFDLQKRPWRAHAVNRELDLRRRVPKRGRVPGDATDRRAIRAAAAAVRSVKPSLPALPVTPLPAVPPSTCRDVPVPVPVPVVPSAFLRPAVPVGFLGRPATPARHGNGREPFAAEPVRAVGAQHDLHARQRHRDGSVRVPLQVLSLDRRTRGFLRELRFDGFVCTPRLVLQVDL